MCAKCKWETELETVEFMLGSKDYTKPRDFLENIKDTLERIEHATPRMSTAIHNIYEGFMPKENGKE